MEKKVGDKTVVAGDFNMNPFDEGMVMASGFHAMMTRDLATEKGRSVDRIKHPFFYNPMWGRFGCETVTKKSPGSYYYAKSENVRYYWHFFDQVLIRPKMKDHFDERQLELLVEVEHGTSDLRKNGKPDSENFSDHLPLLFRLN